MVTAVPPGVSSDPVVGSQSSYSSKTASRDIIEFNDESIINDAELIVDLLFEDIGSRELLSISRQDTVNGQNVRYQPIKNLGILKEEYNPQNLVNIQKTSDKIFDNFPINLATKVPQYAGGANGDNVYLNSDGSLVLEFENMLSDEQVEVQIVINGEVYEAGI